MEDSTASIAVLLLPTVVLYYHLSVCIYEAMTMRTMYEVKLYKQRLVHVLADDVEDAAWQALELSAYGDDILIDVCPLNETK